MVQSAEGVDGSGLFEAGEVPVPVRVVVVTVGAALEDEPRAPIAELPGDLQLPTTSDHGDCRVTTRGRKRRSYEGWLLSWRGWTC